MANAKFTGFNYSLTRIPLDLDVSV
ncbi:uncharacterized protein G2W53_005470 [Senna tora]|uniref:Uncharacterized protein n=1 Tax=Senna tora TaxID=362788 RepID=A0A834X2G8_9FABA|nr:uncharacterized protein G2W53_005470 [Senna tora]